MAELHNRRKEDKFFWRLFSGIRLFLVFMGFAATVLIACIWIFIARAASFAPPAMPDKILLTYTFKGAVPETQGKPSLSQPLLRPATTFRDMIVALQAATKDKHVKGFAVQLQEPEFTLAQVQELRDTLAEFRKAGKFADIYSDSYGESGGMSGYYFASAFSEIWLQPVGVVALNGVAAEVPFVRGTLDMVGVQPQFSRRGIYKSASESLTEKDMSAPNREATEDLVNELYTQMEAGIAAGRGLTADKVRAAVDASPLLDKPALEAKLVDHLGSYDDMLDAAKKQAGLTDEKPVNLMGYAVLADAGTGMGNFTQKLMHKSASPAEGAAAPDRKIAIIFGQGEIVPYKNSQGTFGEGGFAAEKTVEAFKEAAKDDAVAAVIFRIDSPGGSPQAAETVRNAVLAIEKKNKPVIISMGGYAASGGYWIASAGTKIVAEPGTVTGSIGVFGGKFALGGLYSKLNLNWVGVARGANAEMWSSRLPFSDAQYKLFDALLGDTYEAFLQRVMEGRKMTHDAAEKIAEGRVWTGREAKDRGLVDELGGMQLALDLAKKEAKLDPAKDYPVVEFPAPKSTLEQFLQAAVQGEDAFVLPVTDARAFMRALEERARPRVLLEAPPMDIR